VPLQFAAASGHGHDAKPFESGGLDWPVPDYSTVSRQQ
jgi:hypothetical protein